MKTMKKLNMKKLFRRNQIIITTLAIMIAAAGYLNYAGKNEAGESAYEAGMMEISDEDILEENALIAEQTETEETMTEIASLDDPDEGMQAGYENPGEAVLTSGMNVSDYIANVQLSREQIRAKNKETLMNIINNANIEESAKQAAIQDMIKMTEISEKENAAETLLMAKGFADPVVSITDGKVDVVVNASVITDPQRAQIEDIVKRKAEVSADNIIITLLNLEE